MLIVMPEWYGKAEEEIKRTISKIAEEQNIDWHFISDSKRINDSIQSIASHLIFLKNNTKSQFTDEELEQLKKLEKFSKKKK